MMMMMAPSDNRSSYSIITVILLFLATQITGVILVLNDSFVAGEVIIFVSLLLAAWYALRRRQAR